MELEVCLDLKVQVQVYKMQIQTKTLEEDCLVTITPVMVFLDKILIPILEKQVEVYLVIAIKIQVEDFSGHKPTQTLV